MEFKVGDTVSVVDEQTKGCITELYPDRVVVRTNSGFERTYRPEELVKFEDFMNGTNVDNWFIEKEEFNTGATENRPIVIDLHLESIPKKYGIEEGKELRAQLNYARDRVNKLMKRGVNEIIFIHGMGEGVLKNELYSLLKSYNVKCSDAPYKTYGRGATRVVFL